MNLKLCVQLLGPSYTSFLGEYYVCYTSLEAGLVHWIEAFEAE